MNKNTYGCVTLRPFEETDIQALTEMFDHPVTEAQASLLLNELRNGENYAVLRNDTPDKAAGVVQFYAFSDHEAEIGFRTAPAFRNRHTASHAVYVMTAYGHEELGLEVIRARAKETNEDSIHVLEHNGYELIRKEDDTRIYEHRHHVTLKDDSYHPEGMHVLYLAGGCFWGMEKVLKILDGVTETRTGYANGTKEDPRYEDVCRDDTGHRETVRVTYDPAVLPLRKLMKAYFLCIDPQQRNRQGNDFGSQYQTGVYYKEESFREELEKIFEEEKKKYRRFFVELEPLKCFYEAEEYHQGYLDAHPDGYCHITSAEMREVRKLNENYSESE